MLVSCFTNSYLPHSVEDALAGTRAAGLEYVELGLRRRGAEGPEAQAPDEETLARWEARLAELGLQVASVNIMSGDPAQPEIFEMVLEKLRLGKRFGARVAVAAAGEAEDDLARDALYEKHRRLGDLAGELGLVVAFETHPGLCQDARSMLRTMQDLDHPCLRLNFDTANYLYYNEFSSDETALQRVLPYLGSLHLKDSRGGYQDWYFPALGDGLGIDFFRTRDILEAVGFSGPCTIEIEGIQGEPTLSLEASQERVERSVAHLRECGWLG